jgi:hypothetical protein
MAIATAEPTHQAAKPESQKGVNPKLNPLGTSHLRTKLCLRTTTEKFCLPLLCAALFAIKNPVFTWNLLASI